MKFLEKVSKKYSPLYFLSSLGAAGITVAIWKLSDITSKSSILMFGEGFFYAMSIILFFFNLPFWISSLKKDYKLFDFHIPIDGNDTHFVRDGSPAKSTGWMAMPASLIMILNASFPVLPDLFGINMNDYAFYGFIIWLAAYAITFIIGFQIIFNTFVEKTDIGSFHFGLFLQPLTYGLLAIPGVSMASMLDPTSGTIALLLGLTSFTIGALIGTLSLIFIAQRFVEHGFPEPSVAPTSLLIMPSITVYTIFVLRLLHYMKHHNVEIPHTIMEIISLTGIGLMGVAATLGLLIVIAYFKYHIPFNPSWWSFVCPFVSLSVLSSVAYEMAGELPIFLYSSISALVYVSLVFLFVFGKTFNDVNRA